MSHLDIMVTLMNFVCHSYKKVSLSTQIKIMHCKPVSIQFEVLSQRIKNMTLAAATKNIKNMYSSSDLMKELKQQMSSMQSKQSDLEN